MNSDIVRMAQDAFGEGHELFWMAHTDEYLKTFAALVLADYRERLKEDSLHTCHADCQNPVCLIVREAVAAEREACAKVCEKLGIEGWRDAGWDMGTIDCASAIRARGQNV